VNKEAVKLSEADAQLFHHYVAKLLFLCKRARPDIRTAFAFLSTREQNPDTDDYKKLTKTIKYLRVWADIKGRQTSQDKMVGGCIRCCTPQHAEPHRSGVDLGRRGSLWLIHKTEVEHIKLN